MNDFVRVPPDGAGKKVYAKQHTVATDTVFAQGVHLADPDNPSQMQAVDNRGAANVRFAEGQPILSGFGNLKVTQERAIGVYESSLDTYEELFSHITAGGGAFNYVPQESSEILSVDGAAGSSVISMTNRYHYYLPGTSNLYKFTASCGDSGKAGNVRRWGAFDANDGLFFELHGTTVNAVIRGSTSGSVVETKVPQSQWNLDKLDGTGLSGFTLDVTKINVWWIDYQWLGAGRVRFGVFADDGSRVTAHVFENAGMNALPYMRTGTLPAAMENTNLVATGSTSELRSVCIGVYTEGDFEDYTFWRYSDVEASNVSVTNDTHLFSVRAKPTINGKHNSVVAFPESLNIFSDQPVAISLWQDTTLTGADWQPLASTLDATYAGAIADLGQTKFKTIYCNAGVTVVNLVDFFERNDEAIQTNADGTSEIWTCTATQLTGQATTVTINLGYKELW